MRYWKCITVKDKQAHVFNIITLLCLPVTVYLSELCKIVF